MDADSSLDHVFFPDSGVVSVVAVYADGSVIEMATIGREGCTGMQAFFGAKISSVRLLVQIPGSAAKMSRVAFAPGDGVDAIPSDISCPLTFTPFSSLGIDTLDDNAIVQRSEFHRCPPTWGVRGKEQWRVEKLRTDLIR